MPARPIYPAAKSLTFCKPANAEKPNAGRQIVKSIGKLITLGVALLTLASSAYAQSPREQLRQMVQQLQKAPSDNALREKIITLAATLKPALALPEEAERHMAYGTAAFTGAKSPADYKEAVKEFEQATLAAPWHGDAYFNLGVAQDKAENYEAALRSLNLARLASPDSKDIKTLIYQVEYRNKKAQATPKSGETFRDCTDCAEMVVIPLAALSVGVLRWARPKSRKGNGAPSWAITPVIVVTAAPTARWSK
jgi:tetratricopeptide (TPR) repeat protein